MNIDRRLLPTSSLRTMLVEPQQSSPETATIYVEASSFPGNLKRLLAQLPLPALADEIEQAANSQVVTREAEKYRTGAAVFWSSLSKCMVLPPLPVTTNRVIAGQIDTSPLFEVLQRRCTIGTVLLAWGSYGIGVFDDGNLVAAKTGTGYIHKKHKKGGRSQKRFARRTEEQKRDFLRKVSHRAEEIFSQYALDHIFFGGNRLIRKPLYHECRYLQSHAEKISERTIEVRYADKEALSNSLSQIMKSSLFIFHPGDND